MEENKAYRDVGEGFRGVVRSSAGWLDRQLQTVRGLGAEALLWALRGSLDRALNLYQLGNYAEASESMRKLTASLDKLIASSVGDIELEPARLPLMRAMACTVLGQINKRLGEENEARANFGEALYTFDKWLPQVRQPTGQEYGQYGVALHEAGRREEAITALRCALVRGFTTSEIYRHLGTVLKNTGAYEESTSMLRKALELAPTDSLCHKALAETLEAEGLLQEAVGAYLDAALIIVSDHRYHESLALIDHALRLEPNNPQALVGRGTVLLEIGHYEEALHMLDRALELEPENSTALGAKGAALRSLGNQEEALLTLNQLLTIIPDQVEALNAKQRILRALNRNEEAVEVLQRLVELSYSSGWAHAELGDALVALARYEEALPVLDRALELEPENSTALGAKGAALRSLGHYKDALPVLEQALKQRPDDSRFMRNTGYTLLNLGRFSEALQQFEKAADQEPDNPVHPADATLALLQLPDSYEDALTYLDRALHLDSRDVWVVFITAIFLYSVGEYEEAARLFEVTARSDPPFVAIAWGLRGEAYRCLGQQYAIEAMQSLERAQELDPGSVWHEVNVAEVLRFTGETERAYQKYRGIMEQTSKKIETDSSLIPVLAWCHYRVGEYEEAARLFVESLSLALSEVLHNQFNLSITLLRAGRHELALNEYQRSLSDALAKSILRRKKPLCDAFEDLSEATSEDPDLLTIEGLADELEALRKASHEANLSSLDELRLLKQRTAAIN